MDGGAWWAAVPGVAGSRTRWKDSAHSTVYHTRAEHLARGSVHASAHNSANTILTTVKTLLSRKDDANVPHIIMHISF